MTSSGPPKNEGSGVRARRVLGVALIAMLVLHVVPPGGDPEWVLLGFIPWELGYRLLWMVVAAIVVLFMTGPAWPDEPPPDRQPPLAEPPEGTAP